MVFSSLGFLFLFFPVVFIVYMMTPTKYTNIWLMVSSLVFYYIGDKEHIFLLLSVILIAYIGGLCVFRTDNCKVKIILTWIFVISILVIMSYYKYCDFIIDNINNLFGKNFNRKNIIFPIGISFFCFQAISYVIDVFRGEKPLTNPIDVIIYISFFPQLIAGPIVRFKDIFIYMDYKNRKKSMDDISEGIWRFCIGLSKKVILANNLGVLADLVFEMHNISHFSILYTWLGVIAYTLQIYIDFSSYSDMAIGLGRIFGFRFQENFNFPYIAMSIKDFWRRWHISLSQFFRDYIYIPLGGNRVKKSRWIINILVVWFLTGMWHGASWNYIAWGLGYGIILLVENIFVRGKQTSDNLVVKICKHLYTMIVVALLWVLFRAENIVEAIKIFKNMFGISSNKFIDAGFIYQFKNYSLLIIISILCCMPVAKLANAKFEQYSIYNYAKMLLLLCVTLISVSYIYMGSYNPFLYFMF